MSPMYPDRSTPGRYPRRRHGPRPERGGDRLGGVRSQLALYSAVDQARGRMARKEGDEHQPASGGLDLDAPDDLLGTIIAPLYQYVGTNGGDGLEGCLGVEDRHGIDGHERAPGPRREPRPG